jgi:hypothetical protein
MVARTIRPQIFLLGVDFTKVYTRITMGAALKLGSLGFGSIGQ